MSLRANRQSEITAVLRQDTMWFRAVTPVTHLWGRLTEPPDSITGPPLRQQSRLMAILCISALTGGLAGFTISHYGLGIPLAPSSIFSTIFIRLIRPRSARTGARGSGWRSRVSWLY